MASRAINEFASRRFSAYALVLKVDKINSFRSGSFAYIEAAEAYEELVEEGDITPERRDEKLKAK